VNFLIKRLPVHRKRDPSKAISCIEYGEGELPVPHEWVDKEDVP